METSVVSMRRWLAYQVVAGHGLGMFVLFAAPLQFFLLHLAKEHLRETLLTSGLMVLGFAGTIWLAPMLMAVTPHPVRRGTAAWKVLRLFRAFVGNGDAIQMVARRIDPGWQNPYDGRSAKQTTAWLMSMEMMHWATFVGSIPPVVAAFLYGFYALGFTYVLGNLLYNLAPNLVIRDTRRRLLRISQRIPATSSSDSQRFEALPEIDARVDPSDDALVIAEQSDARKSPVNRNFKS